MSHIGDETSQKELSMYSVRSTAKAKYRAKVPLRYFEKDPTERDVSNLMVTEPPKPRVKTALELVNEAKWDAVSRSKKEIDKMMKKDSRRKRR